MITRKTDPYEHTHPDGVVTNYEVETIKRDGAAPIFIMRNSVDNKGYGFNRDLPLNEHLTQEHATDARKEFDVKPNGLIWYAERKDGGYDQVKFKFDEAGIDNSGNHKQQWSEHKRIVHTKEQVDQNVAKYISLDKEEQQKFAEMHNLPKQSFSEKNIDRAAEQKLYEQQKKQDPDF